MEDLITDIISRVSVKDLTRFTCVSKPWRSLVHTDPYLHRLHFLRTASLDRHFLFIEKLNFSVIQNKIGYWNTHYFIDLDFIDDRNTNAVEISDPFDQGDAHLIGSCHGLLVLRQYLTFRMVVSNPTTKEQRLVPPNPVGDDNVDFLGFGYDHVHDRYKLVTRMRPAPNGDHDVWRKCLFDDSFYFKLLYVYPSMFVYVDGALYYYVNSRGTTNEVMRIVRFDLASEEFHVLERPDFGEAGHNPMVAVFDGRVCLSCMAGSGRGGLWAIFQGEIEGPSDCRTEFWMMEGSSYCPRWTKFLIVPDPDFQALVGQERVRPIIPIRYSACRNRILFEIYWRLFWYAIEKKDFTKLDNTSLASHYDTVERDCVVRSLVLG